MRGSGRSGGGFDVDGSSGDRFHRPSAAVPPKYRTVISIQPDDQPRRRSYDDDPAPSEQLAAADPDETASVASSTSSLSLIHI